MDVLQQIKQRVEKAVLNIPDALLPPHLYMTLGSTEQWPVLAAGQAWTLGNRHAGIRLPHRTGHGRPVE